MAELKFKPVKHDHKEFLARARARKGFSDAYDALELEYQVAGKHTPSLNTLERYAHAVGCKLQVKLVPEK